MNRPGRTALSGVILLALVIGPMAPARAATAPTQEFEFSFDMAEVLAVGDTDLVASSDVGSRPDRAEPLTIAEIASASSRGLPASSAVYQNQETSAPAPSNKGRTGRWLKKHWWVPVLVGVAVGVVLLEPFDDDDDEVPAAMMPMP